jgi:excisionase family DNA binding protein
VTGRDRLLQSLSPEVVEALEQLVDQRVRDRRDGVAGPSGKEPPWLSVVEAAELLRCKRQRIDDLLSQGRLSRYKDGARTLVSRSEVEEYLRNHQ